MLVISSQFSKLEYGVRTWVKDWDYRERGVHAVR